MQWKDEIVGLWPTPVLRQKIADQSVLGRLVQMGDSGGPGAGDTFFASDEPAIAHLRETIADAVHAYFRQLQVSPAPAWRLRGRLERLDYGESRGLRNVSGAILSGIFYIRTPKDTDLSHLRSDSHPGSLTLFDPRPGFNMLSIKNDPYRVQSLMAEPEPGLLLMWPAFVNFYRHPNLSRTTQLCVRFDVIPSDGNGGDAPSTRRWQGDIHELWPTGLIKRRLPEHEGPNRELIRLIDDLERERPDLTTDFNTDRLRSSRQPAVQWLMSHINQSVTAYFRQMGMTYPIDYEIRSWPNINRFGDYHSPHNHPWCYLSGTYYVQVPEANIDQPGSQELYPGSISFYDPRSGMTPVAMPPDSRAGTVYTVKPVAGAMMIWPSAVYHQVHPNLSTRKRYSISFNVHLHWRDHYL